MVKDLFRELSLSYLTDQIGINFFSLTRETFSFIVEDGHFDSTIPDKELASVLLQQILRPNFF